jgi:hypothetical protein
MIAELLLKCMVPDRTSKGGPGASADDGDDEAVHEAALEVVVDAVSEPGIDAPAEDPKFIAVATALLIASGEEAPQPVVRNRTKDQAYKDAMRTFSFGGATFTPQAASTSTPASSSRLATASDSAVLASTIFHDPLPGINVKMFEAGLFRHLREQSGESFSIQYVRRPKAKQSRPILLSSTFGVYFRLHYIECRCLHLY